MTEPGTVGWLREEVEKVRVAAAASADDEAERQVVAAAVARGELERVDRMKTLIADTQARLSQRDPHAGDSLTATLELSHGYVAIVSVVKL